MTYDNCEICDFEHVTRIRYIEYPDLMLRLCQECFDCLDTVDYPEFSLWREIAATFLGLGLIILGGFVNHWIKWCILALGIVIGAWGVNHLPERKVTQSKRVLR